MKEVKKIEIKDMKVGDEIAVAYSLNIGWGKRYRYPIWKIETVKRITPKKTKVVTEVDGNMREYTKDTIFAIPSDETKKQTDVAKAMYESDYMADKIARFDKSSQKDDAILSIYEHLSKIMKFLDIDKKEN